MPQTFTLGRRSLAFGALVLTALGVAIGTLAGGIGRADDHESAGSSEVRVLAERLEDGRLSVGLQQRTLSGEWGRIYRPELRIVPADSEPGRVLRSSPVELDVDDGRGAAQIEFEAYIEERGRFEGRNLTAYNASGGAGPGASIICANYDVRNENRQRYCDGLEETYEGTVVRVDGTDRDQFAADLAVRIAAGDAAGGIAATSYSATIIAGRAAIAARLAVPIRLEGSLFSAIPPGPEASYCFIHHGLDEFWWVAREAAARAGTYIGIEVPLLTYGATETRTMAEDQAAAIRACIEAGAAAITTTLPAPDGVREALAEADAAGIPVVSFNSGAESAAELGSAVHIAVDEAAIGRLAGEEFTRLGATGKLLCLLHEEANIALRERCAAAGEAYEGGELEEFPIHQYAGDSGPARARAAVAERLGQGDVGAVLTLGAVSSLLTFSAVQEAREETPIVMGVVGLTGDMYNAVAGGRVQFAIWDQPALQSFLTTASMVLVERMHVDAAAWFGGAVIRIEPTVLRQADMIQLLNDLVAPSR